jgi:predicted alpha/beta superfamily hydrolase
MQPAIVVGIYNTSDRSQEYTPGEKGTAYMHFVVNQVKPLIDQTYRTMPGREHTVGGGSSAGGIISFMLAWEYPQVFSKAICMSPAFKIEDIDYVKTVRAYEGKKKDLFFYIDNGGIELETRLQPGVDAMLTALREKGYREGDDYYWVKAPGARHSEAAWAKRLPLALKRCFPYRKKL